MRHALSDLPLAQQAALAAVAPRQHERDVHPALLDAACAAAKHLVGELSAPSDPLRGGRRQTHLLLISGIEKVRNGFAGLGKDGSGQIEQLLVQVDLRLEALDLRLKNNDLERGARRGFDDRRDGDAARESRRPPKPRRPPSRTPPN